MLRNFNKLIPTVSRAAIKQARQASTRSAQLYAAQDGNSSQQTASKLHLVVGGLAAIFAFDQLTNKKTSDSCGIVGICGSSDSDKFLLEGLSILRNRGYDSVGIASIPTDGHTINVTKFASTSKSTADSIDLVREHAYPKHNGDITGIGHTRWATHGGRTDENAHPHTDIHNRIAVVHNGTINNHNELRDELKKLGVTFSSETDTEVIAQLIGHYINKDPTMSTKSAVAKALSRCEGTWGLGVINKANPEEIVVACNGSPMVIGFGQECTYVASETSAFNRFTKNFIAMKDGEIAVVSKNSSSFDLSRVETAPDSNVLLTPAPYAHFTLKEAFEQPESIARAMSYGARFNGENIVLGGLDNKREILKKIDNLMLTGCGTSKYAAEFGAKLMRELGCFHTVSVMDSAEVRHFDIPHHRGAVMAVSQSGETKDVHRAIKLAQDEDVLVATVVNTVGSLIARTSNLGVYLNAGREQGVASTKAFTSQVTVLALIALWFRNIRDDNYSLRKSPHHKELLDALQRLPISFGMALRRVRPQCQEIAKVCFGNCV
jgi:glucosamine--fructose-6-phosphate aminotransferase (isomerizing)